MTSLPIVLPEGYVASVDVGDKVHAGEKIAAKSSSSDVRINILEELTTTRKKAKNLIKKIPGEKVDKGDIIAVKKSFFGADVVLRSRVSGTIVRYERDSGDLVIKSASDTSSGNSDIVSPVEGIIKLCDNKKIVIDTDKNVLLAESAVGDEGKGEIFFLSGDDPHDLGSGAIGKIIVGKKLSREMILKGIGIGAAGIVGAEIDDRDLEYLIVRKLNTPVAAVSNEILEKIREWSGKNAFIDGGAKSIILLSL
jgi:hypothetical protein